MIVYSPDFDSHVGRLEEVLQQFWTVGLKLKNSKCEVFNNKEATWIMFWVRKVSLLALTRLLLLESRLGSLTCKK